MKRITPRIVIEPKEIISCEDCPFFTMEVSDSPYHYGIDSKTLYCNKLGKELKDENKIDKDCPLQIIEE